MCAPLDGKYIAPVLKEYAETPDRLTLEECEAMGIPPPTCEVLVGALGYGRNGVVTEKEHKHLVDAGAAEDFLKGIEGKNGKKAFRLRVRWLVDLPKTDIEAVKELGDIVFSKKGVLPSLIAALHKPELRWWAAEALARVGKPAISALIAALKDSDVWVRRAAAWALGQIGRDAKAAIPSLMKASKDPDEWVCAYATAALRKIRGK
jgi:HEAT repeat protein